MGDGETEGHFLEGYNLVMTLYGYKVYKKNGAEIYDILPGVDELKLEMIIDYMLEEGLLDGEDWVFLT